MDENEITKPQPMDDEVSDSETTPPPYDPESLNRDIDLLKTIGANPTTAQFLNELASGADTTDLLRKYFPDQFQKEKSPNVELPEPAMYRSRNQHDESENHPTPCPTFLAHIRKGFWD